MNGNHEVKSHAWLKDFNWSVLNDRKILAPFVPSSTDDNFDLKHVNNNDWKDAEIVAEN